MNVLQIGNYSAYPPKSGGANRVHGLVSAWGDTATVNRFVFRWDEVNPDEERVEIEDGYVEFNHRSVVRTTINELLVALGVDNYIAITRLLEPYVLRLGTPHQFETLRSDADVIIIEHPWQVPWVDRRTDPGQVLVYSSHNVESEFYAFLRESTGRILWSWIRRIERSALERADLVVTTTRRDAETYREEFGSEGPFHVALNGTTPAPAGHTIDLKRPPGASPDSTVVLFVGQNANHNVRAAEHVLDLADRADDDRYHFAIVGSVGDRFDPSAVPENAELLGFVEDIEPYYLGSDIAVNPVTSGGGSNIKMVEYLEHGLPTVTTPFGARGLPIEDERHVLVAPIDDFPEELDRLVEDEALTARLSANGQDVAARQLRWEHVSSELLEKIREVADAQRPRGSTTD